MMERIRQKVGRIKEHLVVIRSMKDDCRDKILTDPIYRGALLHYLYLMADSCIVLAELVIKYRDLRLPQSYAESFDILGENGLLDKSFAYDFAAIAGFRNFLAHDYEKLEHEIICGEILDRLDDVDEYIRQLKKALSL